MYVMNLMEYKNNWSYSEQTRGARTKCCLQYAPQPDLTVIE